MNGIAACSCLPGYIGTPPNCRPECLIHSECASNLACIDEKCRDPCPGACGFSAECSVIMHNAVCRCQPGYQGDPFTGCRRITTSEYHCMLIILSPILLYLDTGIINQCKSYVADFNWFYFSFLVIFFAISFRWKSSVKHHKTSRYAQFVHTIT